MRDPTSLYALSLHDALPISCIKRPRSATRAAPSCSDNAPAHTNAEYSPRLWPASCAGRAPPRCSHTRHTATLRSEEHTSELQSRGHLVCRLLLEKIIKYR